MQGLQAIALTLAAICGAIWALYTFNVLRLRQKARVDLEKSEAELRQQAVVDIQLDVSQPVVSGDSALYVSIAVTLKNVGNRNTHLITRSSPVVVSQVVWSAGSTAVGRSYAPGAPLDYVLRVGNTNVFPFLLRVDEPGIYRVVFMVELSHNEIIIAVGEGQKGLPVYWASEAFFVVKPLAHAR